MLLPTRMKGTSQKTAYSFTLRRKKEILPMVLSAAAVSLRVTSMSITWMTWEINLRLWLRSAWANALAWKLDYTPLKA